MRETARLTRQGRDDVVSTGKAEQHGEVCNCYATTTAGECTCDAASSLIGNRRSRRDYLIAPRRTSALLTKKKKLRYGAYEAASDVCSRDEDRHDQSEVSPIARNEREVNRSQRDSIDPIGHTEEERLRSKYDGGLFVRRGTKSLAALSTQEEPLRDQDDVAQHEETDHAGHDEDVNVCDICSHDACISSCIESTQRGEIDERRDAIF